MSKRWKRNFKRRWRRRFRRWGKWWKAHKPAYSKVLMVAMILLCLEIVVYAEVVMWYTWDVSSLYALVGVAASLAAAIWAYCEKSKAENTKGGITYETAMEKKDEPEPNADGTYG